MPIQTIMFTVYNLKFPCNVNPVSVQGWHLLYAPEEAMLNL